MARGGREDDVFDELIDKAGAGTVDRGVDKTSGWIETSQMFRFPLALTQMEQIAASFIRDQRRQIELTISQDNYLFGIQGTTFCKVLTNDFCMQINMIERLELDSFVILID